MSVNNRFGLAGGSRDNPVNFGRGEWSIDEVAVTATAAQINAAAGGDILTSSKFSAYVSTTANLDATYSNGANGVGATLMLNANGTLTLDGVGPLAFNTRVLVKNQTTPLQNGIYLLTSVGSVSSPAVLTRAPDYNGSLDGPIKLGDFLLVSLGTTNGESIFAQSNAATIVVGTTDITFSNVTDSIANPQHANSVFSGPASGSPATPTFRTLTTTDLPVGVWYSQGHSAFSDITNGSDANTFFASAIRPLQTITAAQTYLASVAASARCANFIAPGTYAESGTLSLGANIFVTGSESQYCNITSAVNINNTTWNVNADLRSGFIGCNLTNSLLFNFTSQTNNAQGKVYLVNCTLTNAPVMTAQNTANQLNIRNTILTGGITALGGAVTSINSTCNGDVNVSSSAFANTSYTAKGGTMGGNYSFVSTGGNAITVYLRGVGTSSTTTLSATGNVTIVADYLSLPTQANITLTGGATLQIVSPTLFDNAAKSSLDVQNRQQVASDGITINIDYSDPEGAKVKPSIRTSPSVTVGFDIARQPNLNYDTEITFSVTITNGPTQASSVTLQISPDGTTWQTVGGQSSAAEQPSTAYYFNKVIQRGYYYRCTNSSTGSVSMSQVTELTLGV